MNKVLIVLLIGCLGVTASASAQGVYKYVKDGKVVYSDQPPPSVEAEKIEAYSNKQTGSSPATEPPSTKPADSKRAAIRSQECDKARARLVQYQNAPTLVQSNLKGEQKELTASERIDVIVRAQTDVNQLCDEQPTSPARNQGGGNFTADVNVNDASNP